MSDDAPSFMSLLMSGQAKSEQIDDFIDRWHEGASVQDLHVFLGMSAAEYSLWLIAPHSMPLIAEARASHEPLADFVENHRTVFARTNELQEVERVDHWLADHQSTALSRSPA